MSYKKTRPNHQGKTRARRITDADIPELSRQLQDDVFALIKRYQQETGICVNTIDVDWHEFTSVGGYYQQQPVKASVRGMRIVNGNVEETWLNGVKVEVSHRNISMFTSPQTFPKSVF